MLISFSLFGYLDGSVGVKQQCNFEEEQSFQVGPKTSTTASSCGNDEAHGSPDTLRQGGLLQIRNSMNRDGKTKDPSSLILNKQNVSPGGKNMQCDHCKEMGHVSQFCTASSALKASAASSMKEVTNKSSKWKDVVAVALLSSKHKSNKLPGQSDELPSPSSSHSLRNLATPAGGSMLEWQQTRSDLNSMPPSPDDTKLKPNMMSIPGRSSLYENLPRVSAIPDHDYIWQYDTFFFIFFSYSFA